MEIGKIGKFVGESAVQIVFLNIIFSLQRETRVTSHIGGNLERPMKTSQTPSVMVAQAMTS
jgi:hypothetical protein